MYTFKKPGLRVSDEL